MKDIKWTNKEIKKVQNLLNNKRYEEEVDDFTTGILLGLNKALNILDQLDEQEVLSQEWIVEHSTNFPMSTPMIRWVEASKLRNLLVPTLSEMETVEITEEQAMEWLDNNDFYDHATAETVLENAVDKGELGYYGTKYSVVEKTVIPRFVANWIEETKRYDSLRTAFEYISHDTIPYKPNKSTTNNVHKKRLTIPKEAVSLISKNSDLEIINITVVDIINYNN